MPLIVQTPAMRAYFFSLDEAEFKKQRRFLVKLASGEQRGLLSPEDQDAVDGLLNLTDAIADQAMDEHGLDVGICNRPQVWRR